MSELSAEQKRAVEFNNGIGMVIAGPGSGKTSVLTRRLKRLVNEGGIDGNKILVITFSRAAARSMQDRFLKLNNGDSCGITFGTFHSVFLRILKQVNQLDASSIVTEAKQKRILEEVLKETDVDRETTTEQLTVILAEISAIKGAQLSLENYHSHTLGDVLFRNIFLRYQEKLHELHLMDFDDILSDTLNLLKTREDIRTFWQRQYAYILIDEFQDISPVQYETARILALPQNNLYIVGDDDQSIYRFRGAEPGIMLNFDKDYPAVTKMVLSTNYRCDANIVALAGRLIRHNTDRFEKNITAFRAGKYEPKVLGCEDSASQYTCIASALSEHHAAGLPWKEMAVLMRTNVSSKLTDSLMKAKVPFTAKATVPNMFEHWIFTDLLSYLAAAMENQDPEIWLRIINRPNRYIRRESLSLHENRVLDGLFSFYRKNPAVTGRLHRLEADLSLICKFSPAPAIHYIRNVMQYDRYLAESAKRQHRSAHELTSIADALENSAASFRSVESWLAYREEYTKELKNHAVSKHEDQVTLGTMHASKGLEYSFVILPDLNEGKVPSGHAVTRQDLEEERRLFYVGITRAKDELLLTWCARDGERELLMSRFIAELR